MSGGTQETAMATPASDVFPQVTSRVKVLNYVGESWSIEQEDTSFSTVGTVRTKDGREINFNVNVNMSRRCEEYYREELNVAQFALYDPLVINLDTDATELSDQTFYFDLDADGEEEEISMLKAAVILHWIKTETASSTTAVNCSEPGTVTDLRTWHGMMRTATAGSMRMIPSGQN